MPGISSRYRWAQLAAAAGIVPGVFQPGVQAHVRRVAASVLVDQAAGARRGVAAGHRLVSRRHLLQGRVPKRGFVHDHLQPAVWPHAAALPGHVPPG